MHTTFLRLQRERMSWFSWLSAPLSDGDDDVSSIFTCPGRRPRRAVAPIFRPQLKVFPLHSPTTFISGRIFACARGSGSRVSEKIQGRGRTDAKVVSLYGGTEGK